MECEVGQGIQSVLGEIRETRKTDDSSVDATEGCEAKHFCRVVTVFVSTSFGRVLGTFWTRSGERLMSTYDMAE